MKVDVVVVGAGPAGSTVAEVTSSEGLDVIVLEKEPEIGRSPCAGYVSCMDFPDIKNRVIQSKINRMRTYFPSGKYSDFPINGFNVDRARFDRELASDAARCGARYYLNSRVIDLIQREGFCGVRTRDGREIEAKVIVGADGVSSTISRLLEFRDEVVNAVQYDVSGCKVDPQINEIYFDVDYAPGCYVWIFPTGRDSARVGLAVRSHLADRRAVDYLNNFIDKHPTASKKFRGSSRRGLIAGAIPVGGLHREVCRENILLVGDAAGMADPVTGAGISYATCAGRIAARVIVKAIKEDDISLLKRYERGVRRVMDKHYERSLSKRKLLDSLTDNKSLEENLREVWVTFRDYWHS